MIQEPIVKVGRKYIDLDKIIAIGEPFLLNHQGLYIQFSAECQLQEKPIDFIFPIDTYTSGWMSSEGIVTEEQPKDGRFWRVRTLLDRDNQLVEVPNEFDLEACQKLKAWQDIKKVQDDFIAKWKARKGYADSIG